MKKKYTREVYGLQSLADDGKRRPGEVSDAVVDIIASVIFLVLAVLLFVWAVRMNRESCEKRGGTVISVGAQVGCVEPPKAKR